MKVLPLKAELMNWVDGDVATYRLACVLGILPPDNGTLDGFRDAKHMFNSADPTGEVLSVFLQNLARLDVVEYDPSRVAYRWKPETTGQ